MPRKSDSAASELAAVVTVNDEPDTPAPPVAYRVEAEEGLNRWPKGTLLTADELGVPPPTLAYLLEIGVLVAEEERSRESGRVEP